VPIRPPPYFIIIERALRDEGTSYHYMAASDYSHADAGLISALDGAFGAFPVPVLTARPGRPTRRSARPSRRSMQWSKGI
jgi:hypothetical protein